MKLFNKLIELYNADVEGQTARWSVNGTQYVHTGERIYTEIDNKLVGRGKASRGIKTVLEFVGRTA